MDKLSVLERLVEEDFGLELNGENWARAVEHDSLVISREKQIFFWNQRDLVGDAYVYLTQVRHWSHNDSKDYLCHNAFETSFITELKNKDEVIVYPRLVDVFHDALLRQEDKDYFYRRNINDETISRFKLGFHDDFYMIPIYQDGLFKQFQMRRDVPTKLIRNYYKGVGGLLFNSEVLKYTDTVVLVEGVTSCLVLNQEGITSVSTNTGADGFMMQWFPYFIHQKLIYLLYDNDEAGRKGAIRTSGILGVNKCKIYTFDGQEKGYDANDFIKDGGTKEELMSILRNDSKYSFELGKDKNVGRN